MVVVMVIVMVSILMNGFSWTNCNLMVGIPNMNLYVLWKLYHNLFPYTCVSAKLIWYLSKMYTFHVMKFITVVHVHSL